MAITKKSATPTPEASAIEQNEAAKAALITAEEKVQRLSDAADEADLGMDSITESWNQGDETASAADFSIAQIEFKRATALHEAAQRSAQAIERSVINVDKTLAEIVKPWIEAALPGVSVSASFLMPAKGKPSILPVAYVVQTAKAKIVGGGVLTGTVEAVYVRSPLHREIDAEAIVHAASLAGCQIEAGVTSRSEGDYMRDTARVTVKYGHEPTPVIKEAPSEALANRLAQSMALALAGTTKTAQDAPLQMLQGGGYQGVAATVKPNGGKIVKDETDSMGSRQTEVQVSLTYWLSHDRELSQSMDTKLRGLLESYADTFTQGLGVCQSAKTVHADSPDYSGLHNVAVLLSFVSRIR